MKIKTNLRFATTAIHAGYSPETANGSITPPIYTSNLYVQKKLGIEQKYHYSRCNNPTREAYENCIAALEKGKHGIAFASGMAAITAILNLLETDSHIIVVDNVYGGSFRLFEEVLKRTSGLTFSYVDMAQGKNIEDVINPKTKMIWAESPTNPMLKIIDLKKIAAIAHKHQLLTAIDNTFATPWIQNPLEFGFDIVMHSATKYLNGHSDVLGGIAIINNDKLATQLRHLQMATGAVPSPTDCYTVLRSVKTLDVRMERHCYNAMQLALWLAKQPQVEKIYYPGLKTHPEHQLAKKQMRAFGGVITFVLKGNLTAVKRFIKNCKLFKLTASLGGVESLVTHPATMSHMAVPKKERLRLGISDNLLRLSIGIENLEDLREDLEQALKS